MCVVCDVFVVCVYGLCVFVCWQDEVHAVYCKAHI